MTNKKFSRYTLGGRLSIIEGSTLKKKITAAGERDGSADKDAHCQPTPMALRIHMMQGEN